ncbi:MAG: hypothetical protein N839_0017885, partial [Desulfofustis sp. PB-SRB1]|nr:hypothetical protein [Desulfofustis sp. PB-SRB1]
TKAGRNALAIRLKKRSGGDRDLWFKWDEKNHFHSGNESLQQSLASLMDGVSDETLSGSLLYRLANLKEAIRPLALATEDLATNRERIVRLIGYEIGHSVKIRENAKEVKQRIFAEQLAGLMVRHHSTQPGWYNPEAAVIARFLAVPAERREQ